MIRILRGKKFFEKNSSICDGAHITDSVYSLICSYDKTQSVFPFIFGGNFYGFS